MPLMNSNVAFGTVARFLHWSVFALFVLQYVAGTMMSRIGRDATVFGASQGFYYEWHKSLGLLVILLAIVRFAWRKATPMPDWAPALSEGERRLSHRIEMLMYLSMFVLPLSGLVFVMAGGYGVKLFNAWPLPNPIGKQPGLADVAHVVHLASAWFTVVFAAWHVGMVLKKHYTDGGRLLQRMVPFGRGDSR